MKLLQIDMENLLPRDLSTGANFLGISFSSRTVIPLNALIHYSFKFVLSRAFALFFTLLILELLLIRSPETVLSPLFDRKSSD